MQRPKPDRPNPDRPNRDRPMRRRLRHAAAAAALAAVLGGGAAPAAERVSQPDTAAGIAALDRGDYATAYRKFRSQAARGDAEAQFELGMLYALGKGVEKDLVTAWMWTEIAARQKEPYADFIRDEVAANLKAGDIDAARHRANEWMRANGYGAQLPAVPQRPGKPLTASR